MALRQDLKGPRPVKTPTKRAFSRMVVVFEARQPDLGSGARLHQDFHFDHKSVY